MAFSIRSLIRSQSSNFQRRAANVLCFTAAGACGLALVTSEEVQQRVRYGPSEKGRVMFPTRSTVVGRAFADSSAAVNIANDDEAHRKVVFAFDTTDASQYAFEWALNNFFHSDDTVLLLNVRPSNDPPQEIETRMGVPLSERQARLQEIERLDRIHYELSEARGKAYEAACREKGMTSYAVHAMGNPAVRIVDVGAENNADVIVLGTHDRGALGRLTIGGVPTYVVHNAHCPVIVARPKKQGPVEHESPHPDVREGEPFNYSNQESLNRKNNSTNLWRLARKCS